MTSSFIKHFTSVVLLATLGSGCARPPVVQLPEATTREQRAQPTSMAAATSKQEVPTPETPMVGYYAFTQTAYEQALSKKTPTLLYFYANWCPYCLEQDPRLVQLFADASIGVIAFRVNFNDTETDANEKVLAKKFNVTYQHTFIMLDQSGKEVARATGTLSDEKVKEMLAKGK